MSFRVLLSGKLEQDPISLPWQRPSGQCLNRIPSWPIVGLVAGCSRAAYVGRKY